jgi:Asp/Glu/hydantoin racemase
LSIKKLQRLKAALKEVKLINQDGSHCIALGCTGTFGLAETIEKGLMNNGHTIPVIDPLAAGLKMAGILAEMKLRYSKLTYQ